MDTNGKPQVFQAIASMRIEDMNNLVEAIAAVASNINSGIYDRMEMHPEPEGMCTAFKYEFKKGYKTVLLYEIVFDPIYNSDTNPTLGRIRTFAYLFSESREVYNMVTSLNRIVDDFSSKWNSKYRGSTFFSSFSTASLSHEPRNPLIN